MKFPLPRCVKLTAKSIHHKWAPRLARIGKPGHSTASNAEKSTKGAAGGDLPWGERWEARHGGAFL